MHFSRRALPVVSFVLWSSLAVPALTQSTTDASRVVTIYTPAPQQFDLSLTEVQLEWTNAGADRRQLASAAVSTAGTRLVSRQGMRATFEVVGAESVEQLVARVKALESANVGAEGELVLYDRGSVPSDATRHVLTKEVGVVLKDPTDPDAVLDRYAKSLPRIVSGVPGGYVITADDPLSAVALADALRLEPGVVSASPQMRQLQFVR